MIKKNTAAKPDLHDLDSSGSNGAALAALPVYSVPEISGYLTKGYWKDQDPDWRARSWDMSVDSTIIYNIDVFSPEFKAIARLAFSVWDELTNLTFVEDMSGGLSSKIDFTANDGGSYESDNVSDGNTLSFATINIDPDATDTDINSTLTETFIHEIGHALGLGHGGDYNGAGGGGVHYQNDTRQFSIMSYGAQGSFNGASSLDVLTPQMADIYSVIRKYGAATVRETDTVYGFNASGHNAGTEFIYDFDNFGPTQEDGFNGIAPALTIYDSGGIDTLDLSGYFFDQKIDLRGGRFSDAGQFKGNIGIYLTTVIENGIAGEGSDAVIGNKVGNNLNGGMGEDMLSGLGGNDFLTGGDDADIFKFGRKGKIDHITDFVDAVDVIDLSSMDFKSFAKVDKLARDVGTDLVINFGNGDKLIIDNFSKALFDDTDIALVL